jgi:hypothetical protein
MALELDCWRGLKRPEFSAKITPAEDEQHERHSENLPLILNPEKTSGWT